MHILLVSSLYAPFVGGAERQAQNLARVLVSKGVRVTVLTQPVKGAPDVEKDGDIEIFRWLNTIPLGPLWGVSYMWNTLLACSKLKSRWDIAHSQQVSLHSYALLQAAHRMSKPVLLRFACMGDGGDLARIMNVRYGRFLLPKLKTASRSIVLSNALREEVIGYGFPSERIRQIPNGVDADLFIPNQLARKKNSKVFRFLVVGRLDRQKGIDILLQAFAKLEGKYLWELVVCGDGPLGSELEQLAQNLGLGQQVYFKGHVENVLNEYHQADILVLPSLYEGMPNAVLEAMACGLPIIGTDIGGTRELIIEGVTGWIVPPGSPETFSNVIKMVINDQAMIVQIGEAGRQRVEEHFSLPAIADQYIYEYEQILCEKA